MRRRRRTNQRTARGRLPSISARSSSSISRRRRASASRRLRSPTGSSGTPASVAPTTTQAAPIRITWHTRLNQISSPTITWNDASNCIANQLQVGWSAIAPDSLTAVEILPGFNWQVAGTEIQMNPCPSAPYRSTREFLEATVQRTRPGARVLDYQDQPEIAQQMARAVQANPQANQQAQVRHDAGRLLIGYAKDGVEMREVLSAVVSFSSLQGNVVGGTATISSIRAPDNRLDVDLGTRVLASMRATPQWLDAMKQRSMASLQRVSSAQSSSINDWHNRQMAIINARGAADRAAIRMRTNQEVSGIYNAIAANTSATSDSMHKQTMSGIREVDNYAGVDGATVQSSIHGGSQVFQDTGNPANAYSTDAPYPSPPSGHVELEREQ